MLRSAPRGRADAASGTGSGEYAAEATVTITANASMTRGMLAQALYNFDRSAAPNDSYAFADARGKWCAGAASWAASVIELIIRDLSTFLYVY